MLKHWHTHTHTSHFAPKWPQPWVQKAKTPMKRFGVGPLMLLHRQSFHFPSSVIWFLSLPYLSCQFEFLFFFPPVLSAPRMLDGFESLPEAMFMNYLWSLCCIHEYHLPSLMCSWHPETIFDLFFNFSHSLISHFIVSYFIECTASDLSMFPRYQWQWRCFLCGPFKYFFFSFCYLCSTVSLVAFCGKPVW